MHWWLLQELCEGSSEAKALFDKASDVLGYDLLALCAEGAPSPTSEDHRFPTYAQCTYIAARRQKSTEQSRPSLCAKIRSSRAMDISAYCVRLSLAPSKLHFRQLGVRGSAAARSAGPKEKLDSTAVSQPAIYVASLAALEKLKVDQPDVVAACDVAAGLSLGEYTALAFAGALTFEAGLQLVRSPHVNGAVTTTTLLVLCARAYLLADAMRRSHLIGSA
jgi:malonyl CoA-acyl carrier protein transacylase